MSDESRTIAYVVMDGECEDKAPVWVTLDRAVADAVIAADTNLWIDEVSLIDAVPQRSTRIILAATLEKGALTVREHEQDVWGEQSEPCVHVNGPRKRIEGNAGSWSFILSVTGTDRSAVETVYARELDRLLQATAIPPKMRPTVEIDRALYPRAEKMLGRPNVEFVRVGSAPDWSPVLVAMSGGIEVRRSITDEQADELTAR
jgi:hypothetical protein